MKVILVFFLSFGVAWATFLSCECGKRNAGRIVGGKHTKKNEYPWMVALQFKSDGYTFCGGTIVTKLHVLTAAHCVHDKKPFQIGVAIGAHDVNDASESTAVRLDIDQIRIHASYDVLTNHADVALLVTASEIIYNEIVGPACMPNAPIGDEIIGKMVKATGWGDYIPGFDSNKDRMNKLREVDLEIQSVSDCDGHKGTKICTYTPGKDTCSGDSGGPIVLLDPDTNRFTLVGVVSSGPANCGNSLFPGKNTNIGFFREWVFEEIRMSVSYFTYAKPCYKITT